MMMTFHKKILALSILSVLTPTAFAEDEVEVQQITAISATASKDDADDSSNRLLLSSSDTLQSSTTIGEALKDQLGIYADSFGAGASRPVIRGQDGARAKVLQNGSDTMDVSTLSPDHAVMVDPQLAKKVELIRGPETLLYGAGSVGGLVNVVDNKIATEMPAKGYEGTVGLRYNTGNDETLAQAGVTVGLSDHIALRVEGLSRDANNYIVPNYSVIEDHGDHQHVDRQRRVADTFAKSDNFNLGLSWIGDRGYAGVSYSNRQDKYGLPGHSHEYESCHLHGLSLHCGDHDDHDEDGHDHDQAHSHNHGHGHEEEEHDHAGPWIDLKSERYDFRSELNDPFAGFKKLKASASYTDYQHDEIEEGQAMTTFKSKAYDGRLELFHNPIATWEGVIGLEASQQKLNISGEEATLAPNKTQKWSLFAAEHKQWNDVLFQVSSRFDQQKIDISSAQKDFDENAFSYAGSATWSFAPNYKLALTASHQERLPLAQELYSDGKHFATNTYELGNDNLSKEKSNNLELGLNFDADKFSYGINLYHQWYDNFIYAKTLDQYKDFRLIQYSQDKARFYGAEAQAAYQITDRYKLGVFGDYVRGKIDNENAPRVPAGRLGTKVDAQFSDAWTGSAEYYHVFKQDKFASYEHETEGYNMLNLALAYAGKYSDDVNYKVFFNANNLLDDQVYNHTSFLSNIPQIGRNFSVGLTLGF